MKSFKEHNAITEAITVGKTYDVSKFDGSKNLKVKQPVKVVDYIKRPGSKDTVVYSLKGKNRSVNVQVFKNMIKAASKLKEEVVAEAKWTVKFKPTKVNGIKVDGKPVTVKARASGEAIIKAAKTLGIDKKSSMGMNATVDLVEEVVTEQTFEKIERGEFHDLINDFGLKLDRKNKVYGTDTYTRKDGKVKAEYYDGLFTITTTDPKAIKVLKKMGITEATSKDLEVVVSDNGKKVGTMKLSAAMKQYNVDKGYHKGLEMFFKDAQADGDAKAVKIMPKWRKTHIDSIIADDGKAAGAKEKKRNIKFQSDPKSFKEAVVTEKMDDHDYVTDIVWDVKTKIDPDKNWNKFKKEVIKRANKMLIKTDGYEIADILSESVTESKLSKVNKELDKKMAYMMTPEYAKLNKKAKALYQKEVEKLALAYDAARSKASK